MSNQINVHFSVKGLIREDRQTSSFVVYCPTLDLYSAGRTRIDAKKALVRAVDTYVRVCFERGILGKLLKDRGFNPSASMPSPDAPSAKAEYIVVSESTSEYDDVFDVDVPLSLVVAAEAIKARNVECPQ